MPSEACRLHIKLPHINMLKSKGLGAPSTVQRQSPMDLINLPCSCPFLFSPHFETNFQGVTLKLKSEQTIYICVAIYHLQILFTHCILFISLTSLLGKYNFIPILRVDLEIDRSPNLQSSN